VKTGTAVLLGVGVLVAAGGGYFLLVKRAQAATTGIDQRIDTRDLAAAQAQLGAKAVANSGGGSVKDMLKGTVAGIANKYIPGSGTAAVKVASKAGDIAVSAIKKLKFW
jgi:hypothetical protein